VGEFLLVPAYPGSPGSTAVEQLCVCVVWNCTEHKPSEILQFALQLVCHIMLQLLLRVAASVIAHNYIYRFVVTCHCRTPTEDAVASTSLATVSDVRPTEDAEELPRKSF